MALPLLLVPELLALAAEQDRREQSAATERVVRGVLAERDEAVLAELAATPELPRQYIRIVAGVLAADREARTGPADADERLRLTEGGRSHLLHLRERGSSSTRRRSR